jgi:peptidoglycan L-alanyl-D-glutamate endopeptidase CwlK
MNATEMRKEPKFWQRLLREAGYYKFKIDGIRGPRQEAAEFEWERASLGLAQLHGLFDARSEENIRTLIPAAQKVARVWLGQAKEVAARSGLDVKIICGTRTYGEQDALYKKRPKVTNARGGYSWHNFGLAWDFGVFCKDGKQYFEESPLYKELGKLARNVQDAEWGGDWTSFKDEPHVQVRRYASIREARTAFERS